MKKNHNRHANLQAARADLDELKGLGYQVHEFMPWHWRITKLPDYKNEVDVWPTKKKVMDRETWKVTIYNDLLNAVQSIFDKYMP